MNETILGRAPAESLLALLGRLRPLQEDFPPIDDMPPETIEL